MRVEVDIQGRFGALMSAIGQDIREAADEATKETTEESLLRGRGIVASALSPRVANTLTSRLYPAAEKPLAGFLYSRFLRRSARGGGGGSLRSEDVLHKFTIGGGITPGRAGIKYLLISLLGGRAGRRTRFNFKDKDIELRPLKRGRGFLVIDFRGGVQRPIRSGRGRGRIRVLRRGTPIAILKNVVFLRRRLDLRPVEQFAEARLPERFIINLERRDVLT